MDNLHYFLKGALNSTELSTRLNLFELDISQRIQQLIDKTENKLQLHIDLKANKSDIKEQIREKAGYSDLN
jgi:ribosomal protein L23